MKRCLDVIISLGALIVLAPLLLGLGLLVWLSLGPPILFRQVRTGLHGTPFTILKFRTMRDVVPGCPAPADEEARITRLGRTLRHLRLDELPQLWNIVRGEMSLVGPRPLYPRYLPLYSAEQARRHLVRPGLSGWAQINGDVEIGWERQFELDVWYVDNQSLRLDAEIVWRTLILALRRLRQSGPRGPNRTEFAGTPGRRLQPPSTWPTDSSAEG